MLRGACNVRPHLHRGWTGADGTARHLRRCCCRHQKSITGALKEADISVRRRALDLLFAMATPTNAPGL